MEEKKTYALLFSINCYEREELAKMSHKELYELACAVSTVSSDEASILSPDELSYEINEDLISLDFTWLYFVTI